MYPLAKSLPMGFAWSLWICQQIGECLCQPAGNVPLRDRGPSTVIGLSNGVRFVRPHVHVDNLGMMGCSSDVVPLALSEVTSIFKQVGLSVHDLEMSGREMKALPWVSNRTVASRELRERYWRLDGALSHLLARVKANGEMLEVLVGYYIRRAGSETSAERVPRCIPVHSGSAWETSCALTIGRRRVAGLQRLDRECQ